MNVIETFLTLRCVHIFMDIETLNMRIRKGEKLRDIVPEHKFNAYRQKLYRYRKKLESQKPIFDKITKEWINESKNHYFSVYTLDVNRAIYVGWSGDLEARLHQHRYHTFHGQNIKIISCEFFYDKDEAKEREKELIFWHNKNGFDMKNILIAKTYLDDPPPPMSGEIKFNSGLVIPSYIGFINWCRKHHEISLTAQMVKNCEDNPRKHWRSIVINTFELLTYYLEEG